MGQFLRVRLQRRHVLVLRQVKHLDGAGIRRADFLVLVLFLICAVFTTLKQTNVNIYSLNDQIRKKSLIQLYSQFSVHTSICKSLQSKRSVLQIIQRSWVFVRGQIGDELFMNQNVFVLSIALRFSTPPFFWEGWQQKSANNNSARNHHLVTGGELSFWGGYTLQEIKFIMFLLNNSQNRSFFKEVFDMFTDNKMSPSFIDLA